MHCQSSSCDASGKINCATVYAVTGQLYVDEIPEVVNLDAGLCPLVRKVRGDRNALRICDASVGIPCAMQMEFTAKSQRASGRLLCHISCAEVLAAGPQFVLD